MAQRKNLNDRRAEFIAMAVSGYSFIIMNFVQRKLFEFLNRFIHVLKKAVRTLTAFASILPSRAITYWICLLIVNILEVMRFTINCIYALNLIILQTVTQAISHKETIAYIKSILKYTP